MGVVSNLDLGSNQMMQAAFPRVGAFMQSGGNGGGGSVTTENLLPRVQNQQPFPRLQTVMEMRS